MNALRSVLVHLDGSPRSAERLHVARSLAAAQGATVTAMLAANPALVEVPLSYLGDAGGALLLQEAEAQRTRDARALFDRENARPGPTMRWHDPPQSSPAISAFSERALLSDLTVLGQHDRHDPLSWGVPRDFVPAVLAASGRPGLVVPAAGPFGLVGLRILVAWKPTREAAHAVTAALPLLTCAQTVRVVMWEEPDTFAPRAEGLADFLSLHGVQAHFDRAGPATGPVGELLLSRTADAEADLLVMGCYGHARAREWLLGGVTRTVLKSMPLPVLMAH